MKAVVCQDAQLRLEELPEPVPCAGQALLAVERCGICGSDLHMRQHCDALHEVGRKVGFGHALRQMEQFFLHNSTCSRGPQHSSQAKVAAARGRICKKS